MEPKERIIKLLEDGKINAQDAAKLLEALRSYSSEGVCMDLGFGHHHRSRFFKPGSHECHFHPGRKKMIVKLAGICCPDPRGMKFTASGCCD